MEKYKTQRIEPLSARKQTDYQEYYVLAVLKAIYPEEYKMLKKKESDRPDLKSIDDSYGVEVTTADSEKDNEDDSAFVKYRKDKDPKYIESFKNRGKIIDEKKGITIVKSGGGYYVDADKELLIRRIRAKIESVKNYPSKFKRVELVILKNELVPSVWTDNVFEYISEAIGQDKCIFEKIYVIYCDNCYCYYKNGNIEKIHIDDVNSLKLLAYLTSLEIIKNDDFEWCDSGSC